MAGFKRPASWAARGTGTYRHFFWFPRLFIFQLLHVAPAVILRSFAVIPHILVTDALAQPL